MRTSSFTITENQDPTPSERLAEILAAPGFGEFTTDHVAKVEWTGDYSTGGEWEHARIEPYAPLSLDPATSVFHYGQEIFEGLKAYRHQDGSVWLFRPEANADRFRRSAKRLALPELPTEIFIDAVHALVEKDSRWIPEGEGTSLYIRPFMIATEKFLGVRPTREALFEVIASPAANYFGSPEPVDIWWSQNYARAGQGGTGAAKCGGNYAASLLPQLEGEAKGCKQVMFTDEHRNHAVEELGGMNVFFVLKDGTLVTPKLTGTILEGVTRKSIVELAQESGMKVVERTITVDEWQAGIAKDDITEIFACGTAAVIAPMGRLLYEDGEIPAASQTNGRVTQWLRAQLTGIQTGRVEDRFGWMTRVI
ncbi:MULTISPECIES: branched-chain amino acid aminotransferase [Micrococcaceae]|uniref:branched-chain amino acid aminotransferase n=1 Tax=unclassified Kocuria TaxID=2649579 RepID=UPI001EDDB602|nr:MULTISPECIES: branched-chain amino acid aminotransferase [unclassified Kocuria]